MKKATAIFIFFLIGGLFFAQNVMPLSTDPVVTILSTTVTVNNSLLITVEIPGFQPPEVYYDMTPTSSKLHLDSVKKLPRSQNGIAFTVFEFTFRFLAEGSVRLPQITVTYNNKHHKVILPEITVVPDITSIIPTANWLFESKESPIAGRTYKISLSTQNAAKIEIFTVDFNKNTLLEQINIENKPSLSHLNNHEDSQDTQGTIIGYFNWTPLTDGMVDLPIAHITAQTYAGNTIKIQSRAFQIRVQEPVSLNQEQYKEQNDSSIFEKAFREPSQLEEETTNEQNINNTNNSQVAQQIAALRYNFKKELFPLNTFRELKQIENTTELKENPLPNPSAWIIPFFAIAFVLILITILCRILLNKNTLLLLFCASIILFMSFFLLVRHDRQYVISTGGSIKTIPEHSAKETLHIPEGLQVLVLAETVDWLYIQLPSGETGWTKADTVLHISGTAESE